MAKDSVCGMRKDEKKAPAKSPQIRRDLLLLCSSVQNGI
jgi:hypothetical protein